MLGSQLCRTLTAAGHDVTPATRPSFDLTDPAACAAAVGHADWVVNCAAYTAVDAAESHEGHAFEVNALGPAMLGRAARLAGARLLHVSTDYVFSGDATTPYAEDAPLAPRSAYGRTKAAGEWAVRAECPDAIIVRTAWLYGPGGPSFVAKMAQLAGERETVSVVSDQIGQPTTTAHLSLFIAQLIASGAPAGVYHGTCVGTTSWHGLAQAVFQELGLDPGRVLPISTAEYPLPAPRPAYSVLGHARASAVGVQVLPHWRVALATTIASVTGGMA
jgi:dTDP-4-dehydrorhamnose reductase